MVSSYVYIVYLFLISRQTHRFFFHVCMLMQLMQVFPNCNVLNAMKVDAVDTGVCSFYAKLHAGHAGHAGQAGPLPLQEGRTVQPSVL